MTSTTIGSARQRSTALHPLAAALTGAAAYALAMTAGEVFGLNADAATSPAPTTADVLAYAGMVLAAVTVATLAGAAARSGSPGRLAGYALGLAIAAAVTTVVFWSGWPQVLGAVAVVSSLEHQRRTGGFSVLTGIAASLGALVLLGTTVLCVFG